MPLTFLSALARRMRLVPLLVTDPKGFRAHIAKDAEILSDRLRTAPVKYAAISWPEALRDLDQRCPGAAEVAREPQLAAIEDEVRRRLAGLQRSLPYHGDFAMGRCAYILCRLFRPDLVIETGVAYGVTSAFILQALSANEHGVLRSVDLAPLGASGEVGVLVPDAPRSRWQLICGSSRDELPTLVVSGPVGLFLHDSLHTYRNMKWEFETVWPHLRPGGALMSDDVNGNAAFAEVAARSTFSRVVQGEATTAQFGIAFK